MTIHKFQCVPALHLYNKLFPYMSPMVIKWSAPNEQFELQGNSFWGYWRWCFNTFIVAGVIGFGSCMDVIAHRKEAGSSLVVISCGFASLSCLFWACAAVMIWNKDELVRGIIDLRNVLMHLGRLPGNGNLRIRTGTTWRMNSYAIQLAIITFAYIPFILTPGLFIVGLDPFRYTFRKIISPSRICESESSSTCHFTVHLILFFSRVTCSTICNFEACRFFAVLFAMLIYILELVVRCIDVITHAHITHNSLNDNLSFSKWYTALRIAHKVLYPPLCSLFALILGVGFIIILSCNIATVRAFNILPIEVYWLMPMVSVLFSFLEAFALPYAVRVFKSSEEMVHARKVMLSNHRKVVTTARRKLDKRESAAIRPIVVGCGGFFDLEKGSETTYFDLIFVRTVDGLLIPM